MRGRETSLHNNHTLIPSSELTVNPAASELPLSSPTPHMAVPESLPKKAPMPCLVRDMTISEAIDPGSQESKYVTFHLLTFQDELFFGQLFKKKKDITL